MGYWSFFWERTRIGVAFCIALGFQLLFLEVKPFARRKSNLLTSLANLKILAVMLLLLNTQAHSIKGGEVAGYLLHLCEPSVGAATTYNPGASHVSKAERD